MRATRSAAQILWLLLSAAPAVDALEPEAELAALKDEIARLTARVAELEARLTSATPETPRDSADSKPVSPTTPAMRSPQLSVGGRIKLDAVYNDASTGSGTLDNIRLNPGAVPLDPHGESEQLEFSARASRLWLKSWLPTALGEAGAYLEFDLFGDGSGQRVSNGYGLRLRHAYAELGGILVGQTYSTFVNVSALPELNDDGIGPGVLNVRQPLLRFSRPLGAGRASFAFENPETTLRSMDGRRLTPDDDRVPDLVLRYDHRGRWGEASFAVLGREIRIDDPASRTVDATFGGAVSMAGTLTLGLDDVLRFNAVGGNAIGRYMSLNAFDAGRLDATADIVLGWATGGYLSWQHFWSARWRSNLTAGYAWQDDADAVGSENEMLYSVHANLLWSPVTSTSLGLEWIHAYRRRFDGRHGDLDRLQFSAVHKF